MKAEWTNKDSLTSEETTKAILVIDVPMLYDGRHLCNECPIWNDEHWFCQYDFNMKAKGCPLKPLPKKLPLESGSITNTFKESTKYKHIGYNTCLDEIVGETE